MPVMMTPFLLQILPPSLLGIFLRGVLGQDDHRDPGLGSQPLLDFFTGVMRGLILPEEELALRTGSQEQLVPPDRGVTVLPINGKGRHLCTRAQMHCPIEILGTLLPRPIDDYRLLPNRTP